MEEAQLLQHVPLFKGLTEEQLRKLSGIAKRRQFGQGDIILREGEPGDSMYIVTSGSVEVTQSLTLRLSEGDFGERSKTLMRSNANEPCCLGEMAVLGGGERSATVTATSPCEALEIERQDFQNLAEADPLLGYRIMTNIAQTLSLRLRKTNRDVLKLATALSLALGSR